MKLKLTGHDYKYAVEQIMLMLFPEERPEYSEPEPGVLSAEISLSTGGVVAVAITRLYTPDGRRFCSESRVSRSKLTDKLTSDRLLQRCVKMSFYKAAVSYTGRHPVWGALTGIRPGKLVTGMLLSGYSERRAVTEMMTQNFVSPERAHLCLDTAKAGLAVKAMLQPRDICLYIGIPFCPTRCAYCSFVSNSVEKSMKLISPFLDTLFKELESDGETVRALGLRVISVYIGGGTPTTLSAGQLDELLGRLADTFDLSNVREFTVEAGRPDTITPEKLSVLLRRGVTRVSVNPQTMDNHVLEVIGRRHTARDVENAVSLVRDFGIPALNTDLIAGLPSDTYNGFRASLDRVLAMSPENVTVHTLSLKKGTKITLEGTGIPSGEEVGRMLDYAESTLRARGYRPYYLYRQKFMSGGFENVGWCLPGFESLYNICIMEEMCTILSMGGGGSTKLVCPESGRIERIFNPKYPQEYISGIDKTISKKQYVRDFYESPEK